MSTLMLIACAMILAQVLALSLLVGDAIHRERVGEPGLRRVLGTARGMRVALERRRAARALPPGIRDRRAT